MQKIHTACETHHRPEVIKKIDSPQSVPTRGAGEIDESMYLKYLISLLLSTCSLFYEQRILQGLSSNSYNEQ